MIRMDRILLDIVFVSRSIVKGTRLWQLQLTPTRLLSLWVVNPT